MIASSDTSALVSALVASGLSYDQAVRAVAVASVKRCCSWRDAFNEVFEKSKITADITSSASPAARTRHPDDSAVNKLPSHEISSVFAFKGPEEQCEQLLCTFESMDTVRRAAALYDCDMSRRWEIFKREIQIPLCMGISGIGKSTFAREGAWHAMLRIPPQEFTQFHTLLQASYSHGLNYQIPCDVLAGMSGHIGELAALYLLFEFCKHQLRPENRDFTVFTNGLRDLTSTLPPLDISDALEIIVAHHPNAAIVVNISGAHAISVDDKLRTLLQHFSMALLCNIPVYFTVTGSYFDITAAASAGSMALTKIELPPLQPTHV